jgi:WD40 repeat protein
MYLEPFQKNNTFFLKKWGSIFLLLALLSNVDVLADNIAEPIHTFQKHTDSVKTVVFSPQNNTVLSGSSDNTIQLWDIQTKKEIRTFRGHNDKVYSVIFSPDGNTFLSGSRDKKLRLWDINGQKIRIFHGHTESVRSVAFSNDGSLALSGSEDKTIKVWNIETGENLLTLQGHTKPVYAVAFSPKGGIALSGSLDNTVKLWNTKTGQEIHSFQDHTDGIYSVAFSPDGHSILSGSHDDTMKLWDIKTKQEVRTFKGHSDNIYSVAFHPNGHYVLSGSQDNTMKLWEVATGKNIYTFQDHKDFVYSVAVSKDGNYALSGSKDDSLKLWKINLPPTAVFTVSESLGIAPLTVDLVANSSSDPDGNIVDYAWTSSDGQIASGNSTHLNFDVAGEYTITLTVTDDFGAIHRTQKTVTAKHLVANFDSSPTTGTAPLTVTLNASASEGDIVNYKWATSHQKNMTGKQVDLTFDKGGTYTITLTVIDSENRMAIIDKKIVINKPPQANFRFSPTQGNAPLILSLDGSISTDADGRIESYQWLSQNGQTVSGKKAEMTIEKGGKYTVTLTVTDNKEATATTEKTVSFGTKIPPVAKFTVSPTIGKKPLTVRLDASGSFDTNGNIVSWKWESSNGKRLSGEKTNFILTSVGKQTITLTVTDNEGSTATAKKTVTVTGIVPVAKFQASPLVGTAPLTVKLEDSGSFDSDGNITDYAWTVSDGQQAFGRNTRFIFDNSGSYTIKLQVTDNDGLQSEKVSQVVTVGEQNHPVAKIQVSSLRGIVPFTITLEGSQSSDPDGGSLVAYDWNATDGQTILEASGKTATLTFEKAGNYTLTLTVTDDEENTASDSEIITVEETSQLVFEGLEEFYAVKEVIKVDLIEKLPRNVEELVDLWVAIQLPSGDLLFLLSEPSISFTTEPQPFKTSINNSEISHQILDFEVMSDIGGTYTFYGLYVKEDSNPLISGIEAVQRSNLAIQATTLANE